MNVFSRTPIGFSNTSQKFTRSYRYGFVGQEKVKEISSNGNYYDMGQRFYNPRLGISTSMDPNFHIYLGLSPYHFSANSPIVFYAPDGRDGIRNAANSTITAQVIFIYDPMNLSAVDAMQFENYARTNIQSVWGSQIFNGQLVNVTTSTMTQEQYDLAVSKGLISFDVQTNVITLSSSGRSSVNSDLRTGVWNINNRGNTAAHEFGHLLGLSNRYQYLQGFTTLTGVDNQWIAVLLPQQQVNNDPTYNPYDNLYSTNTSTITNQQLNFVFNASNGIEEGIQNFTFLGNPRSLGTLDWNSRNNGLQSNTFVLGFVNNGNLMTDNTSLRLSSIRGSLFSGLIYSLNSDNYAKLLRNQGLLGEVVIRHQSGNASDRFSSGTQTISRLQMPYD